MRRGAAALIVLALAACSGDVEDAKAPRAGTTTAPSKRRARARAVSPGPAAGVSGEPSARDRPGAQRKPGTVKVKGGEFEVDGDLDETPEPVPVASVAIPLRVTELAALEGLARQRAEKELAESIRPNAARLREAVSLLTSVQDEKELAVLVALFREEIAGTHGATVIDALIAILATGEPAARRVAAVHGLADIRVSASAEVDERIGRVLATRLHAELVPDVILAIVAALSSGSLGALEREGLYACATRLVVPDGARATQPERFARREVYALLVSDAVKRNEWNRPVDAFTRTSSQMEKDDIAAGFATFHGGAITSENERAAVLAMRREAFAVIYRGTGDLAARRRLVVAAQQDLDVFPRNGVAPEHELTPAIALARELMDAEADPGAQQALSRAIQSMKHVPEKIPGGVMWR